MRHKNADKDRWITKIRAPFEGVFSKDETRTRYRGIMKVQLQAFLEAIVFNVNRLLVVNSPPLFAGGLRAPKGRSLSQWTEMNRKLKKS